MTVVKEERPYRRLDPESALTVSPKRSVRLPETVDRQLAVLAEQTGKTPSFLIREAVAAYISDEERRAS
ncbi:CopG family ribbon-helix-helix protein [Rhodococcus sp. NPDC058481]|uniref:CopG family ribbon-helix-helix protein n=1 Tax=unclassified Rhodococcus (in: high G+C Gram-positive bacteria) TaxID=192944 RepID=UPI003661189B